jgi:PIN domain nuclease of toxin-antitoxin system
MLLLDTHVWIWSAAGDRRIGRRAQRLIARAETQNALRVSPVSLFELTALCTTGRLRLSSLPAEWIRQALATAGVRLAMLSAEVAVDAGSIPRTAVADPLDRLIVATARQLDATLLTADVQLLSYARTTKHVRVQDAGA